MQRPETLVLERGSDEYNTLARHSGLIQNLFEDEQGNIELSADLLFPNDAANVQTRKWNLFVDVFFPQLAVERLYTVAANGSISIDPARGNVNDIVELLDYLLVDDPDTMMDFAREQARRSLDVVAVANEGERAPREPGAGAVAFEARQEELRNRNAVPNIGQHNWANNNRRFQNNENEDNEPNVRIGHREENDAILARVSQKNISRLGLNERRAKSRRNRRRQTRRAQSSRRQQRKSRRGNRK